MDRSNSTSECQQLQSFQQKPKINVVLFLYCVKNIACQLLQVAMVMASFNISTLLDKINTTTYIRQEQILQTMLKCDSSLILNTIISPLNFLAIIQSTASIPESWPWRSQWCHWAPLQEWWSCPSASWQRSACHLADEGRDEGSTPSGCCSHWGCDHLPAACRQRSDAAGLVECPPCPDINMKIHLLLKSNSGSAKLFITILQRMFNYDSYELFIACLAFL